MLKHLHRRRLLQSSRNKPTPALFLDRDGVLIEDMHHLCDPKRVTLCSGSQALLEMADNHGCAVVVITNQSGIARGYFDWSDYERVTDQLLTLLGEPALIAGIYANGHGPDAPADSWRKPNPMMLLEAGRELNLDLKRSILVGDRRSDLEAGARAGVPNLVHVLTGHGYEERPGVTAWAQQETHALGRDPKPEIWFLDSLLGFPTTLLRQK